MSIVAIGTTFDKVYKDLVAELLSTGEKSVSRKGKVLYELHDSMFRLMNPDRCMTPSRASSLQYLKDEFDFYMSGSDSLEDAVSCSAFWKNCSDDGETINSNYGKLLLHDRNSKGFTQFEHAYNCLVNNMQSKKAVMTLYNNEHAYISNDNPCTMYLKFRISNDEDGKRLHLTAMMRSSDIFFGLPYDVPFFCFLQRSMCSLLSQAYPDLQLGNYTHFANSLHFYEYKMNEIKKVLEREVKLDTHVLYDDVYADLRILYLPALRKLVKQNFMSLAWRASKKSNCLKKQVGCILTIDNGQGEKVIAEGWGDVSHKSEACKVCVRDNPDDKWFGDSCPSIHAEMRALHSLRFDMENIDFSKVNCYVTHNSCDACAKLMDMHGITQVYYDESYKIDETHWPRMTFTQIKDKV